ncbi:PROTEIN putative-RELATED [Salix koriyanagi]|uniref:PROTEIN putative-RELATED n=1 Tax=Salix koriyanagi TaxID=2511006 RepID=A0A9Q0UNQ7_9ROSI|nr:PROTEIN putative-RELATED [Salix koriyanagi]
MVNNVHLAARSGALHLSFFTFVQGQDVFDFSMLSEESKTTSQCTPQLAFLSFVELPLPPKKQMCLDAQFSCHNFIDLQMESEDSYSPCILDIDIEMETIAKPKSGDMTVGSIENKDPVIGVVQRQANLKTCGRFMQLFTNHGSSLLKLISKDKSFGERVHETPNNRWRRYKRTSSFDSRKIVLLFSIM